MAQKSKIKKKSKANLKDQKVYMNLVSSGVDKFSKKVLKKKLDSKAKSTAVQVFIILIAIIFFCFAHVYLGYRINIEQWQRLIDLKIARNDFGGFLSFLIAFLVVTITVLCTVYMMNWFKLWKLDFKDLFRFSFLLSWFFTAPIILVSAFLRIPYPHAYGVFLVDVLAFFGICWLVQKIKFK
jgi:ABC-type uncharacterized transport system fused permease/ATPase subunit